MEKHKDVTIHDRTFRIRKFPARTGAFVLVKVTGMLAPLFKGIDLSMLMEEKNAAETFKGLDLPGMIEKLCSISEDDFNYLQEKCLGVCSEVLPGQMAPVLNENGTFGVIGLEDDTMTILALTAHALIFNLQPVFQGAGLGSILPMLSNSSPRG